MALPRLREELALLPGPVLADGQPSWTLHDPARNRFFSLDWPSYEILCRWSFDDPAAIARAIAIDTPLQLEGEDVERLARFLCDNQLVRPEGAGSAHQLAAQRARQEAAGCSGCCTITCSFACRCGGRMPGWDAGRVWRRCSARVCFCC